MEALEVNTGDQLGEAELVDHFSVCGVSISERQLSGWRRAGLLPDFDLPGHGLGRGLGRSPGRWLDGGKVIRQALAVNEILGCGCGVEHTYLPLWLLGHDVPAERVKEALLSPLRQIRAGITEEVSEGGWDERDFYFELAGMLCEGIADYWEYASPGGESLTPEQEKLLFDTDDTVNLLCNPNYEPEEPLSREAKFLRRHFSLDALSAAVSAASGEDLRRVQEDFGHMRSAFGSMLDQVGYLPLLDAPNRYGVLAFFGGLAALADLGLRASGYGRLIDEHLPNLPGHVGLVSEQRKTGALTGESDPIPEGCATIRPGQ